VGPGLRVSENMLPPAKGWEENSFVKHACVIPESSDVRVLRVTGFFSLAHVFPRKTFTRVSPLSTLILFSEEEEESTLGLVMPGNKGREEEKRGVLSWSRCYGKRRRGEEEEYSLGLVMPGEKGGEEKRVL